MLVQIWSSDPVWPNPKLEVIPRWDIASHGDVPCFFSGFRVDTDLRTP